LATAATLVSGETELLAYVENAFLQLFRELRQIMGLKPIDLHGDAGDSPMRSIDCQEIL
jgi:hypothetical protein